MVQSLSDALSTSYRGSIFRTVFTVGLELSNNRTVLYSVSAFYEKNYNVLKFQVIMAALGMFSTYVLVWLLVMNASLIKVYSSW